MRKKEYTDKTFYRLTGIKYSRRSCNSSLWFWKCTCGTITEADPHKVINGKTKSCGCYRVEYLGSDERRTLMTNVMKKVNKGNAAWQALK